MTPLKVRSLMEIRELAVGMETTFKLLEHLPFDDHYKLVWKLLLVQEERCEELIIKIRENSEGNKAEKKTLVYLVKILRQHLMEQKYDPDRPVSPLIPYEEFIKIIDNIISAPSLSDSEESSDEDESESE